MVDKIINDLITLIDYNQYYGNKNMKNKTNNIYLYNYTQWINNIVTDSDSLYFQKLLNTINIDIINNMYDE